MVNLICSYLQVNEIEWEWRLENDWNNFLRNKLRNLIAENNRACLLDRRTGSEEKMAVDKLFESCEYGELQASIYQFGNHAFHVKLSKMFLIKIYVFQLSYMSEEVFACRQDSEESTPNMWTPWSEADMLSIIQYTLLALTRCL